MAAIDLGLNTVDCTKCILGNTVLLASINKDKTNFQLPTDGKEVKNA